MLRKLKSCPNTIAMVTLKVILDSVLVVVVLVKEALRA